MAEMVAKLDAREQRRRPGPASDDDLTARAERLRRRHLPEAPAPVSVRWVTNQNTRWGSCTPADGTIRLSHRMQQMPGHVIDAVLVHELAHLLVPGHGPRFDELVSRFDRMAEAMGFLEGVSWQQQRGS